jgi:hypothetical protein
MRRTSAVNVTEAHDRGGLDDLIWSLSLSLTLSLTLSGYPPENIKFKRRLFFLPSKAGVSNASLQEARKFKASAQVSVSHSAVAAFVKREPPGASHFVSPANPPTFDLLPSKTGVANASFQEARKQSSAMIIFSRHVRLPLSRCSIRRTRASRSPVFCVISPPTTFSCVRFSCAIEHWRLKRELPGGSQMIFTADHLLECQSLTHQLQSSSNANLREPRILCRHSTHHIPTR